MDEADVVAYTTLTDQYLKRFGTFIENHFCNLVRTVSDDHASSDRGSVSLGSSGEYSYASVIDGHAGEASSSVTLHTSSRHIWDHLHHPVSIRWTPTPESASFEELTCIPHPIDGNPDVQKVMLVLVTITNQARSLKETGASSFVNSLVLYGDNYEIEAVEKDMTSSLAEAEGEGHIAISKMLPVLLELLEYIHECTDFVGHWISQISALFKETKPHVVSITNLQLYTVFREFSDLLAILVILDEVIRNQNVLQEHWLKYRQMIKSVRADSRSFDTEAGNLVQLERDLIQIDKFLLSANIFKNFLDSVIQKNQRLLARNVLLSEKFVWFLTTLASDIEKDVIHDVDEYRPISLAAVYVFTASFFPTCFDTKKVFQKTVWEQLRKVQAVAIPGASVWIPEVFLNSCVQGNGSKLFDHRAMQLLATARQTFLQQKVSGLAKELLQWNLLYCSWAVRLQEVLLLKDLSVISMADLSRKCTLIVEGMKLSQTLSHNFRLILNLHASLNRPIAKHIVVQLCQILELLKSIQGTLFQFSVRLCCSTMYIMQYVMHTALVHVRAAQKAIINTDHRKVDDTKADALSVLKILEHCLRGTLSQKRFLVAQIALDWACSVNSMSRLWKDEDTALVLPACFDRLKQLMNLEQNIQFYCNGSTVFFHRVILSSYFSSLYICPQESSKLSLISLIIRDCLVSLNDSPHADHAKKVFMTEIEGYLKTHFVERLCQDVETDLRILSHTHLQIQNTEGAPPPPFRTGVKDLESIIETPSFPWNNVIDINLKNIVSYKYLSTLHLIQVFTHDSGIDY